MSEIKNISGTGVPLLLDDIDTDRIIPARFLRCVSFDGLGEHAFEDDRQQDPSHPFDNPQYKNGSILVSGRNFGCGSSREHAPQSLMRWGIKGILAESFAEIFFGNCTSLGIPAATTSRENLSSLCDAITADPSLEIDFNLVDKIVTAGDLSFKVEMPDSARDALVTGQWDFLSQLLAADEAITKTANTIPYMSGFAANV